MGDAGQTADAEALSHVEFSDDGSAIVRLHRPIKVDGDTLSRVTIPALRGRHMMSAPDLTEETQIGEVITWATKVVEPRGAVEEMFPQDAITTAKALAALLGKSATSHGAPGSPLSESTTAGVAPNS